MNHLARIKVVSDWGSYGIDSANTASALRLDEPHLSRYFEVQDLYNSPGMRTGNIVVVDVVVVVWLSMLQHIDIIGLVPVPE